MLVFVLVCITLCSFLFCNHLDDKVKAGCFAFIVFWMSCYCKCPVALPHSAKDGSAVCDCGISRTYLLFIFKISTSKLGIPYCPASQE